MMTYGEGKNEVGNINLTEEKIEPFRSSTKTYAQPYLHPFLNSNSFETFLGAPLRVQKAKCFTYAI